MKIRRLRLTGFKSFVDAADLRIEPGLTGVVGPNGCGKSNLLEALRWTMGENSPKSMRGAGMEAEVVPLASDTMSMLARLQPDLVLMDLHMPGQDGFEAARRLRALPAPAGRVPIIALSADVFSETRERVQLAGMNSFVAKPVRPDDIIAVLTDTFGPVATAPRSWAPTTRVRPAAPAGPARPPAQMRACAAAPW